MILLLRVTVCFVLQAYEEGDLLGGRGADETVVLLVGGGGGLGLGDLPVTALEIEGGECRRMVSLGDRSTLTLQVQRWRTQAFSQTVVTESKKKVYAKCKHFNQHLRAVKRSSV